MAAAVLTVASASPAAAQVGSIIEVPLPSGVSGDPFGVSNAIAPGPDGNLWFTLTSSNEIARATPTGAFQEFPVPTANSEPWGIAQGPDGNMWFTESGADQIGMITPGGAITEQGGIGFQDHIGKIAPDGTITEYPTPTTNSGPEGIVAGPDGDLWFAEYAAGQIGRSSVNGNITEIPVSGSGPQQITAAPDGNVWFSDRINNAIGRITTAGSVTEFPLPDSGYNPLPDGIAAGSDGNVWFTEQGYTNIGRVLTGMGTAGPPVVLLSAAKLDFGTVVVGARSDPQTITVKNFGGQPLTVTRVSIGGVDARDFSITADSCTAAPVAPGGQCALQLVFSPSAVGSAGGVISLDSNASSAPSTVTLAGSAVAGGVVSGVVEDGSADPAVPMPGATVEACPLGASASPIADAGLAETGNCLRVSTGAGGAYVFTGLAPGTWQFDAYPDVATDYPTTAVVHVVNGLNRQDFLLPPSVDLSGGSHSVGPRESGPRGCLFSDLRVPRRSPCRSTSRRPVSQGRQHCSTSSGVSTTTAIRDQGRHPRDSLRS